MTSLLPSNRFTQKGHSPLRKVRKFFQISLPARLSKKFGIAEGEYVEMQETKEGILVKPVEVSERLPVIRLNRKEQRLLADAKTKVRQINVDWLGSQGLSKNEARVAAKVGLIDSEQIWWWLESWQTGERAAEKDRKEGKTKKFENVDDLIDDLRS